MNRCVAKSLKEYRSDMQTDRQMDNKVIPMYQPVSTGNTTTMTKLFKEMT